MLLQDKIRQAIAEANLAMDVSTDSESLADASGLSDSDNEELHLNLNELRAPLDKGWRRETVIRGLTKNGQIRGDVVYFAPDSQTRLKHITHVQAILLQQPQHASAFTVENFSFSARAIVGDFLQPAPPPYATDGDYIRMTDADVAKRLEELKMFTKQSLNVEQRIEIARQQQAMRDAKKAQKEDGGNSSSGGGGGGAGGSGSGSGRKEKVRGVDRIVLCLFRTILISSHSVARAVHQLEDPSFA